jgi:hypothetical protein
VFLTGYPRDKPYFSLIVGVQIFDFSSSWQRDLKKIGDDGNAEESLFHSGSMVSSVDIVGEPSAVIEHSRTFRKHPTKMQI